ncbi:heparinase II/III family protein [Aurantiacibacter flavus]|uniref:Heparinase II/III family protein n=1 Tax=Aurantiacibacter flavus TaxID=3145232 RepID=A0ABV0CZR9_9SPHN
MNARSAEATSRTASAKDRQAQDSQAADGNASSPAIPLRNTGSEALVNSDKPTAEPVTQRSLIVTDIAPPAITAGERLMRMAYRLGMSGPTILSPFRKPAKPRLLATVECPLDGDRVAGMALRAGHFLVYGVKAPIAQIDFSPVAKLTPPFERTVHGFSWLRDLESCGARAQCAPVAERVLAAWLDANELPGKGAAWKVENAGLRLLAWLVHAPLVMSGQDKALRTRTLEACAETARWLDRHVGRADDRLGEVAGWCAITAAGLLLPDGKPRRLFGEAGLVRALGEMVGDDGGVLSRSPQAQMQAIAMLIDLRACYRATRREPPSAIESMLAMLVPPLLALMHSDGGLGSWQGAPAVSAERLTALVAASGVRTRPLRDVRGWGYQRVFAKPATLQLDASPPPLAKHARSGCASTLAFEFSYGAHRLIVNCGGAGIAGGQVPVRIEQGLRATAAHSTMVLGDANSTAVLINGKLGGGVNEVEIDRRTIELEYGTATRLEASHDGYAARFGLVHQRILTLREDGSEVRGEDLLVPAGRRGKRGKVPFAIRFHLGPQVELRPSSNSRSAGLVLPDGSYWQFVSADAEIEVDESLWVDSMGHLHPVQQLVIQGLASRGGGHYAWLLKKMG